MKKNKTCVSCKLIFKEERAKSQQSNYCIECNKRINQKLIDNPKRSYFWARSKL